MAIASKSAGTRAFYPLANGIGRPDDRVGPPSAAPPPPPPTAVTCPTMRIHPAVIAQAAATSGVMHEGRFQLGVGSGEALNEHILGDRWPEADVRLEMLEEAVEVIRTLWQGGNQSHWGE